MPTKHSPMNGEFLLPLCCSNSTPRDMRMLFQPSFLPSSFWVPTSPSCASLPPSPVRPYLSALCVPTSQPCASLPLSPVRPYLSALCVPTSPPQACLFPSPTRAYLPAPPAPTSGPNSPQSSPLPPSTRPSSTPPPPPHKCPPTHAQE